MLMRHEKQGTNAQQKQQTNNLLALHTVIYENIQLINSGLNLDNNTKINYHLHKLCIQICIRQLYMSQQLLLPVDFHHLQRFHLGIYWPAATSSSIYQEQRLQTQSEPWLAIHDNFLIGQEGQFPFYKSDFR